MMNRKSSKFQEEKICINVYKESPDRNILKRKNNCSPLGSTGLTMVEKLGLRGKSGQVVLIAIAANGGNFFVKCYAWLRSGSKSMFAEAIHSLVDTLNQMCLAYGLFLSTKRASYYHPYGYSKMTYVSSLVAGVGIFCIGTGLSLYHGVEGLRHPQMIREYFWAIFTLTIAFITEFITLIVAAIQIRRKARMANMTPVQYVLHGRDPCVNFVFLEDSAAVAGVVVALLSMGLTYYTASTIPDALGSLFIAAILAAVAIYIIRTNAGALIGKSIPQEQLDMINTELQNDIKIKAVRDVKGVEMGNYEFKYKAEIAFDGREITKSYLRTLHLKRVFESVKSLKTVKELENLLLKHGENIVRMLSQEIVRIEKNLKQKFPGLRHCDLEII